MFNVSKWKSEVKQIETAIRAHKALIRTTGRMTSTEEWATFYDLKNQATEMYRLRAQYRGKLHNSKFFQVYNNGFVEQKHQLIETLDEQRAWVSDSLWALYVLPDPIQTVA